MNSFDLSITTPYFAYSLCIEYDMWMCKSKPTRVGGRTDVGGLYIGREYVGMKIRKNNLLTSLWTDDFLFYVLHVIYTWTVFLKKNHFLRFSSFQQSILLLTINYLTLTMTEPLRGEDSLITQTLHDQCFTHLIFGVSIVTVEFFMLFSL